MENDCIFCEIIAGRIPSEKVFEDETMLVIKEINPQADIHYLMMPKEHFADITELDLQRAATLGECLMKVGKLAKEWDLEKGFRIISNKGDDGGQTIGHLHFHILGGEKLSEKMR